MKIYTKGGDKGETGLFGGERVSKDSLRIETYGTIDELNSAIGLAITELRDQEVRELLLKIQNWLFNVGSDLATPDQEKAEKFGIKRVPADYAEQIEKEIDKYDGMLEPLRNFILPGGTKGAAWLNLCRTIARRAERLAVALNRAEEININIIIFLNRLSDLFFVLGRWENKIASVEDTLWKSDKPLPGEM
jgi:cob(I)alamin adenosyltransferase